ncbi:MAG: EamA family transporter [Alphaproteobacteria bacterium]|nr:EamA family transporter [Alphaproteobacteria bacterium]
MHGSWNVLVKQDVDRFLLLVQIQTVMGVLGVALIAAFPWPTMASIPYVLASAGLHLGYNIFLLRSYRTGDLSQVYPIARGTAPLLTLVAAWIVTHERPAFGGILGIGILVSGLWFIGFFGRRHLRLDSVTLLFALGTSGFIAAYSIVDGIGGRLSGSPSGYTGLLYLIDAMMLMSAALVWRGRSILGQMRATWSSGIMGGALSAGAYWIVIWAMSQAPIAAVAALRETSILFVVLMSRQVLKEPITLPRVIGAILIALGAILIRFS